MSAKGGGVTSQLFDVAKKFIFNTPKTWAEAVWRGVALWMSSTAFLVVYLAIGFPEALPFVEGGGHESLASLEDTKERQEVIALIRKFINKHQPTRFALVGRVSTIGVKLVWSSEDATHWPTNVDGVMSSNMKPILGHLAFDGCWSGELAKDSDEKWVFCGITNDGSQQGHIVASFSDTPCSHCIEEMDALAKRIRQILF